MNGRTHMHNVMFDRLTVLLIFQQMKGVLDDENEGNPLWLGDFPFRKSVVETWVFKNVSLLKQVNISAIIIPLKRVIQPRSSLISMNCLY